MTAQDIPQPDWIQLMLRLGEWHQKPLLQAEGGTPAERFASFHERNPQVFRAIVEVTRQKKRMGKTYVSMRGIFELLRETHSLQVRGDRYRLNNDYTSFYSRLIADVHPELGVLFRRRERNAA